MFLSYLFIPVSVYIYVSLFLVIHIYPFSCLYMLSLFLVIHIILVSVAISSSTKRLLNKIKKKMQMGINFKKCTYSPLSPGSYLCILFLFLVTHIYPCSHPQLEQKRLLNKIYKNINWEKIGIHEEKTHIHPCSLIIHIFVPVQSSYIFIQGCFIKY
jgi:hypothetical protein